MNLERTLHVHTPNHQLHPNWPRGKSDAASLPMELKSSMTCCMVPTKEPFESILFQAYSNLPMLNTVTSVAHVYINDVINKLISYLKRNKLVDDTPVLQSQLLIWNVSSIDKHRHHYH